MTTTRVEEINDRWWFAVQRARKARRDLDAAETTEDTHHAERLLEFYLDRERRLEKEIDR